MVDVSDFNLDSNSFKPYKPEELRPGINLNDESDNEIFISVFSKTIDIDCSLEYHNSILCINISKI